MQVVVINNREGLEIGQLQPKGKELGGQTILGGTITLLPGLNLIPSRDFADMMKNPAWKKKFDTLIPRSMAPEQNPEKVGKPVLEIATFVGEKGSGEVPDEAPLAKLSDGQCKRMIEECFSADMLRSWNREETRPAVLHLISKQLDVLAGNPAGPASAGR